MFRDRKDGARQLADRLKGRHLVNPLVLAIPRGGVVTGVVLARELGAELDVVLSRKLRAPYQPELAIGAIAEDGRVYLNEFGKLGEGLSEAYLAEERAYQMDQIRRRRELVRRIRPSASVSGRSVIVTDDGIATGSTMIAALETVRRQKPHELIAAVPVASPEGIEEIRLHCDELVCLLAPPFFFAIGEFYEEFRPVEDAQVAKLLTDFSQPRVKQAG